MDQVFDVNNRETRNVLLAAGLRQESAVIGASMATIFAAEVKP